MAAAAAAAKPLCCLVMVVVTGGVAMCFIGQECQRLLNLTTIVLTLQMSNDLHNNYNKLFQ